MICQLSLVALREAKHIDDVFQPNSRVFRLFSFFALHRFHFEEVIHPLMAPRQNSGSVDSPMKSNMGMGQTMTSGGSQVLVLGSIYQGSCLGTNF